MWKTYKQDRLSKVIHSIFLTLSHYLHPTNFYPILIFINAVDNNLGTKLHWDLGCIDNE